MEANVPSNRQEAREQIKETFGFVPDFFEAIPERSLHAHWLLQRELQLDETALDNKTKELIGIAVAAHIKCQYCTYFHTRAAQTFGANDEEIREAVAMGGLTALYSNSLNGMRVDYEQFRKDVERALEYIKKNAQG